jgi:hypothetical protein
METNAGWNAFHFEASFPFPCRIDDLARSPQAEARGALLNQYRISITIQHICQFLVPLITPTPLTMVRFGAKRRALIH